MINVRNQNESFYSARPNHFRDMKLEGPGTAENKDLGFHEVFSFQEAKTESNEVHDNN